MKQAVAAVILYRCRGHYVQGDLAQGNYAEMDRKKKVIRQFSFGAPIDSVMKLTLQGMSFYGI